MKPGDVIEVAVWLDGRETAEIRRQYEADVLETANLNLKAHGLVVTGIRWIEKRPGEPRVPEPPNSISGRVPRLLVAEIAVGVPPSAFVTELEPDDLARLRRLTRAAYEREWPEYGRLTDRQCDRLINDIGPDAALRSLRHASMRLKAELDGKGDESTGRVH